MQVGIRLAAEEVRAAPNTAIGPNYLALDTGNPIEHEARIVLLQNFTNADVMISMDWPTDNFPIPAGGFLLLDVTSNRSDLGGGFYIAKGTRFFVREIAAHPTIGSVYLSVFYAAE